MSEPDGQYSIRVARGRGFQIGDGNTQNNGVSPRQVAVVVAISVLAATALTGWLLARDGREPDRPGSLPLLSPAGTSAAPAPSHTPPVIIEGVTTMRSNVGDGSFVIADVVHLTPADLDGLNTGRTAESKVFAEHSGTSVDFGESTLTLRGNGRERVVVTNMLTLKQCGAPLAGTYFQSSSQGNPDSLRIGFDLDSADPVPQEMGFSGGRGLFPTGSHFFDRQTITLDPGEPPVSITLGAFTKQAYCTFKIRIIVATAAGSFYQDIDNGGAPFRVSATAPPRFQGAPYSGYGALYKYTVGGWEPFPTQ